MVTGALQPEPLYNDLKETRNHLVQSKQLTQELGRLRQQNSALREALSRQEDRLQEATIERDKRRSFSISALVNRLKGGYSTDLAQIEKALTEACTARDQILEDYASNGAAILAAEKRLAELGKPADLEKQLAAQEAELSVRQNPQLNGLLTDLQETLALRIEQRRPYSQAYSLGTRYLVCCAQVSALADDISSLGNRNNHLDRLHCNDQLQAMVGEYHHFSVSFSEALAATTVSFDANNVLQVPSRHAFLGEYKKLHHTMRRVEVELVSCVDRLKAKRDALTVEIESLERRLSALLNRR